MFSDACSFNQPIGEWNTFAVTNMSMMFSCIDNASIFNQPIGNWNTAKVTDMSGTFYGAHGFNQPIGNWNTMAVTSMSQMFRNAATFNQPIGKWNTSAVTSMFQMFWIAGSFNQSVGNWDTSGVTNFQEMFHWSAFCQSIDDWNVATSAEERERDLSHWPLHQSLTSGSPVYCIRGVVSDRLRTSTSTISTMSTSTTISAATSKTTLTTVTLSTGKAGVVTIKAFLAADDQVKKNARNIKATNDEVNIDAWELSSFGERSHVVRLQALIICVAVACGVLC